MLSLIIFLSSLAALSIADGGCCECTQTSDEPKCNDECDATICAYDYDPYCCNVQWDSLCVEAAEFECNGGSYDDDGCSSYGDYSDYGYDDQCDCNEICDEGPDEWEFEYEAIPPCVIESCGEQCNKCASDDECVAGIENVVNDCYYPDKDPKECMDELIADAENNGFTQACNGNAECGADLKALGECVANSANYGICSEEGLKKVSLKSLAKTIKIKSRKLKRKSAALKAKSKRSRSRRRRSRKVRGKRQSKLRKSRRKLLSEDEYGSDDENPEYDYGCYCNCGEEDDEIPACITEACGEQLMACQSSQNCVDGVDGVQEICVQEYDTPEQCVEELIKDSNGAKAIELCNGDADAAGDLQALGQCVLNTFNSGDCDEGQYKKLKIKALVKSTKKVRARKVASKQRRSRSVRRARSSRAQRLRKSKLGKLKGRRGQRARLSKSKRAQRKLGSRSRKEARRVRSQRELKQRSRRKLLAGSTSCCECTESSYSPNCNQECDNTICPYDSYCCNYSWDWICANSAVYECDAAGGNEEPEEPPSDPNAIDCCDCTNSKNTPNCNEGCDATICPYDSYCCNYSWDWICANSAVQECDAAEEIPSDESCCDCTDSKNTPNCNEQCDSTICPYDSYCCNYSWDWICANSAVQECDAAEGEKETEIYPPQSGSGACCECTDSSDSANCNQGCDDTICPYDPYCCNNKWDWICADSAKSECEAAGNTDGTNIYEGEETNPEQGSDEACCQCTETESTSGCTPNPACDAIVCPIDSYCCNYSWDGICANGANNICNAAEYWSWPTEEETGSCCDCTEESDSSGCNEVCENEVCPLDSYCCNNKWDWICANGAENICQGYDYFNSDTYGYDDSYNYDYYEPYYSDSYGYDSYNYDSGDYDTYEPYSYYGGYDSFNDYGYSSYAPNYYDYSSDYGYSSDYSYYEPSYDYYDSFDYGYSSYEPNYDYYDPYNYGSSDYGDYYYEPYSYGGYDSYNSYQDEQDFEDVPKCFETVCGYQIYQCVNAPDCYQGLEAGEAYCEDNYETPEECVETLIQESQSQQVTELCNGNQTAAGYLQELGQCFLDTITSGECPEEQQKKLKLKAMVKAGKKLKTRKVRARRSKQRKARSSKRQSLRSRSSKLRQQNKRPQRLQRRVRTERQRRARSSKRQRSRKVRPRGRARRSLMAQRQSRARPSGRARSARVQKRRQSQRPQRSGRVRARGRSRKASTQRRSRKAGRQSKRLRRN